MKTLLILIAAALVSSPGWVRADLATDPPEKVISYLADHGMPTRGYKDRTEEEIGFLAVSPYREFASSGPHANTLAYYCNGTANQVTKVRVVVSVLEPKSAGSATAAFLLAASDLCEKALGKPMPAAISEVLTKGKSQKWETPGYKIEAVKRESKNSADRYDQLFIIELPHHKE